MKQCTFHKEQSATIRERRRERKSKEHLAIHIIVNFSLPVTYYTRPFSGDVAPHASSFSLPTDTVL
jgi:hypothetical protein